MKPNGASASITIQLEEFDTLLNLDVSQDVKVWKACESSGLSSVKPGQFASLRLASDHRTVNEIHVSSASNTGCDPRSLGFRGDDSRFDR
ncbi:MAG: hypothetical protein U0936_03850 [Planctomycetaceae bacterium]